VGRGRARYHRIFSRDRWSSVSFQSPRRSGSKEPLWAWPRATGLVSIPSEVGRGRAPNPSTIRIIALDLVSFQSPRRWGGVGLAVILLAFDGLRNGFVSIPSEVGRGRAPKHDPNHRTRPELGVVSIPSEVGRGRAPRPLPPAELEPAIVSIPSEVGRGRALLMEHPVAKKTTTPFQSPRRWGGVGLETIPRVQTNLNLPLFQSPRRWGGVGLAVAATTGPT